MRLFTAIEISPSVRDHLRLVQKAISAHPLLKQNVSWTAENNLHLTLKFIGEMPDAAIPGVISALQSIASKTTPLTLTFLPDHLLCFPPHGPARVLSVGLRGDIDPLRRLYALMEDALAPCGVARESRPFHAHITLARLRHPSGKITAPALLDAARMAPLPAPSFQASEFVLMQSDLNPAGSIYTALARLPIPAQ